MEIIHVMKDGTIRDSIEGVVIPPGEFYRVFNMLQEKLWRIKNEKAKNGQKG